MTLGEQLLNLTLEYREVLENRKAAEEYGSDPALVGREPATIASDYEDTLRKVLR